MRIYLVNPSDVAFGVGVITPRWLYVLAAATPAQYGNPVIVDETLESIRPEHIQAGDVVGIGIHTANAQRGFEVGRLARDRGAFVVFGRYSCDPLSRRGTRARRCARSSAGGRRHRLGYGADHSRCTTAAG